MGEPRATAPDLQEFAIGLAEFLNSLERINASGGPLSGAHNFDRGGSLHVYDTEARRAIDILQDHVDARRAREL